MRHSPVRGYFEMADILWIQKLEGPDVEFESHGYECDCQRCRDCQPLEPRGYQPPVTYGGAERFVAALERSGEPWREPTYWDGWNDGTRCAARQSGHEAFAQGLVVASVLWIVVVICITQWMG